MRYPLLAAILVIGSIGQSIAAENARGRDEAHLPKGGNSFAALVAEVPPGQWLELPNTAMSAAFPSRGETTWGIVGPSSVVKAWGGAAFDTKRNALILNGGGHADYGGNEVYAFLLERMKWERLTEPSPSKKLENGQYVTADNTPVSAHTYDGLEYLPNVDRVFRNGGSEWYSGGNFDKSAWLFDPGSRKWARGAAGGGGFVTSAYDPARGTVYVINRFGVSEYDPKADEWTLRVSGQADFLQKTGVLDPVNRKLITNSYKPGVLVYDVWHDGSLSGRQFPRTSGDVECDKWTGLEYDPVRKVAVAWNGSRETCYLDVKTYRWTKWDNPNGGAPDRAIDYKASGGIYGRWRYVPKYDVFIGYNNPNGNVWIWKPVAADAKQSAKPKQCDADLCVGPEQRYTRVSAALADALPGATIAIAPGEYKDGLHIRKDNITLRGVTGPDGKRPHIYGVTVQGKGVIVVDGKNTTIENLRISGGRASDGTGACIRVQADGPFTLRDSEAFDCNYIILTDNDRPRQQILIEDSYLHDSIRPNVGTAHNVYVGEVASLTIRRSRITRARQAGHLVKSRAQANLIEDSIIASLDGDNSREIDFSLGGDNVVRRSIIQKGPKSDNDDSIGVARETGKNYKSNTPNVVQRTIVEDCWIIFDGRRPWDRWVMTTHVNGSVVRNNKIVGIPAKNMKNPYNDATVLFEGNQRFDDRAAAGLAPFPALPKLTKN